MTPSIKARPVVEKERIVGLDVLRGFALLGILIVNIQAFAMPSAAYSNPAAFGSLEHLNGVVWVMTYVFADQKFMSIFSLLFGAGICLFTDRATKRTGRTAKLYYRRTLILLLLGIAHGYLLFYGDILAIYAVCALWVFLMRRRSPRTLIVTAGLLLGVPTILNLLVSASMSAMTKQDLAGLAADWAPSAEQLDHVVQGMRGSIAQQIATRAPVTATLQTVVFVMFFVWRVSAMMLLGMALYKTGVLTGRRENAWYAKTAAITLPLGFGLTILGIVLNFRAQWSLEYSMFIGGLPNYWGSVATALGYIALVSLAVRNHILPAVQVRLAAVGRMALTNYLIQSLLCTLLFNGLGLFGAMPRWQQPLVVAGIWLLQLWWSPRWLARFRMGPCEWLWRALTYGRMPSSPK